MSEDLYRISHLLLRSWSKDLLCGFTNVREQLRYNCNSSTRSPVLWCLNYRIVYGYSLSNSIAHMLGKYPQLDTIPLSSTPCTANKKTQSPADFPTSGHVNVLSDYKETEPQSCH